MQGLSFGTARGTVPPGSAILGHANLRAYGVQQSINYRGAPARRPCAREVAIDRISRAQPEDAPRDAACRNRRSVRDLRADRRCIDANAQAARVPARDQLAKEIL